MLSATFQKFLNWGAERGISVNMIQTRGRLEQDPRMKLSLGTGEVNMASPDHEKYSADRVMAKELLGGKSFFVMAADGVGSGGELSVKASEIVKQEFQIGCDAINKSGEIPTLEQAANWFYACLHESQDKIKKWKSELSARGINVDNVDTTFVGALMCVMVSGDGKKIEPIMLQCKIGDSRLFQYKTDTGVLLQLTTDDTIAEALAKSGGGSRNELEETAAGQTIRRTVGDLSSEWYIPQKNPTTNSMFDVAPFETGCLYIAASDGYSGNYSPNNREEMAGDIRLAMQKANNDKSGVRGIAHELGGIARSKARKEDDIGIAVVAIKKDPILDRLAKALASRFKPLVSPTQPR